MRRERVAALALGFVIWGLCAAIVCMWVAIVAMVILS